MDRFFREDVRDLENVRNLASISASSPTILSGRLRKHQRYTYGIGSPLLKLKHLQEGYHIGLYYLRDASKREVDFLVTVGKKPWHPRTIPWMAEFASCRPVSSWQHCHNENFAKQIP